MIKIEGKDGHLDILPALWVKNEGASQEGAEYPLKHNSSGWSSVTHPPVTGNERPTSSGPLLFGRSGSGSKKTSLSQSSKVLILKKYNPLNMDVLQYLKEHYETVELAHAWRFNGVIDVWKNKPTIFVIPDNRYYNYKDAKEFADIAINNLDHFDPRPAFKKYPSGRISWQEFKHRDRMDHKKTKRSNVKDTDLMPYGKHKGEKMANVPADYLIWLFENNKAFGDVLKYIRANDRNLRGEIANSKRGIR